MNVLPTDNPNEFLCQSETNPKTWYTVNIISGECSCLHWQRRLKFIGGTCKHYERVMNYLKQIDKQVTLPQIEIINGMDAIKFEETYGENVLAKLKREFIIFEKNGKVYKL